MHLFKSASSSWLRDVVSCSMLVWASLVSPFRSQCCIEFTARITFDNGFFYIFIIACKFNAKFGGSCGMALAHIPIGKHLSCVVTCLQEEHASHNYNPENAHPIVPSCLMQQEGKPREARARALRGEDTARVLYTIINLFPSGKGTLQFSFILFTSFINNRLFID